METEQERWAKKPIKVNLGVDPYVGKSEMRSINKRCNSNARKG
jgi:hypothetical protein